jgi:hypothetical protein
MGNPVNGKLFRVLRGIKGYERVFKIGNGASHQVMDAT